MEKRNHSSPLTNISSCSLYLLMTYIGYTVVCTCDYTYILLREYGAFTRLPVFYDYM